MTNREWLESLSDEELAMRFDRGDTASCLCCIHFSVKDNDCKKRYIPTFCMKGKIDWLKAEHNEQ